MFNRKIQPEYIRATIESNLKNAEPENAVAYIENLLENKKRIDKKDIPWLKTELKAKQEILIEQYLLEQKVPKVLEILIKQGYQHKQALLIIAERLSVAGDNGKTNSGAHSLAAEVYMNLHLPDKAAEEHMKAHQYNEALEFYLKKGDKQMVLKIFEEMPSLRDYKPESNYLIVADILKQAGRYAEAGHAYEQFGIHAYTQNHEFAYAKSIEAYCLAGNIKEAERVLEMRIGYKSPLGHQMMGEILMAQKKFKEAAEEFLNARKPLLAKDAFAKLGDKEGEGEAYVHEAYYNNDNGEYKLRNLTLAYNAFMEAKKYNRAGKVALEIPDYDKAVKAFELGGSYDEIGDMYAKLKKHDLAAAAYRKVKWKAGEAAIQEDLFNKEAIKNAALKPEKKRFRLFGRK
jgi:tetratricopeptide (TPR) repeat protein